MFFDSYSFVLTIYSKNLILPSPIWTKSRRWAMRFEKSRTVYSNEHKPESSEHARARRQELENGIIEIKTNLAHRTFLDFNGDEDEFLSWRRKAKDALVYKKQEIRFLDNWLFLKSLVVHKDFLDLVHKHCNQIPLDFPVRFSDASPPNTKEEATVRKNNIRTYLSETNRWFKKTSEQAKTFNISKKEMSQVRRNGTEHIARLEVEYSFVNEWLRKNLREQLKLPLTNKQNQVDCSCNWRILLSIVDRALMLCPDLHLSDEEQKVLAIIHKKSRTSSLSEPHTQSTADP